MNFSFNGLKGRDSAMVQTLRECKRYVVNLVLVEEEIDGYLKTMDSVRRNPV